MKKLTLAIFLFCALGAFGASRSTSGNAVVSSTTNWSSGNKPSCTGDTIVATTGFDLTIDVSCIAGSKASAVGHAIEIQGTNSSTRARVFVGAGVTLTLRGFDTTSNTAMLTDQFGLFQCDTGGTIMVDGPSDMGTIIKNNGNLTSNGCLWTIPAGNINWGNASGDTTLSGITASPYAVNSSGVGNYAHKLQLSSGVLDPGAVSNVAGNGRCSFGDDSLTITAGTSWTTAKSSYAALASDGDYYHDCVNNVVFFHASVGLLTITYHFKYETHFSYGIISEANTTGSTVSFTNNVIQWAGSNGSSQSEHLGGGLLFDDKYACSIDSARCMTVTGNEFDDCTNCIQIYQDNTQGVASTGTWTTGGITGAGQIALTGNTFKGVHYNSGIWSTGAIAIGNASYIKIDGTGSTWNCFCQPFRSLARGDLLGITFTANSGAAILANMLPFPAAFSSVGGSFVTSNNMTGFGGELDTRLMSVGGNPTNGVNTYDSNKFGNAHRAAGILPYGTVTNNYVFQTYHHGCGPIDGNDEYISHWVYANNIIIDSDDNNLGGGCVIGYNHLLLIDGGSDGSLGQFKKSTFAGGTRGLRTNDEEGQTVIWVGTRWIDSIFSDNNQGFIDVANSTANMAAGAPCQIDYSDLWNATTTTPTLNQATFVKISNEYNCSGASGKAVTGVNLWNPKGYTLPDVTSRSLVRTASGTLGSNKQLALAWSGGTAVNLVPALGNGTATGGTAGSAGVFPTLIDSGKTWPTSGSGLRTDQLCIMSGTGAGQCGMIAANDATTLTIVPYSTNQRWAAAPDATSVYLIVLTQVTLLDSGGTNGVYAGVRMPDLGMTSNTDSGITMVTHSLSVNPNFPSRAGANANLHPKNSSLSTAASDGTYMGALPVSAGTIFRHKAVIQ